MTKILNRSKRFVSLLLLSIMIMSLGIPGVFAQAVSAPDIESHWAKAEISSWMGQGFITGYPDGTFKPNNTITRAEFISIVNRLFAFSEKAPVPFSDVKESDWFHAEFAKAAKAGYLGGYTGTVDPNGFITRQEVAAIAAKVKSLPDSAAEANGFADAAMILDANKGAVGAVVKAKVMNGYPSGKFEPTNRITRAEAVVTLHRLFNLKTGTVKIEAVTDKSVTVGSTYPVTLKMTPADAKATVQNSDDKVVEATLNGAELKLKGLKVGTATITVTGKKDGLEDGVVAFKVVVSAASYGGGGGGGSSSGGSTTPKQDEAAATVVQPVVGATEVTGSCKSNVGRVEVIVGGQTLQATLSNGTFRCSLPGGLAVGTTIQIKAYVGNTLVDTDDMTIAEDDTKLTDVKAIYAPLSTQISGKCAAVVTKVVLVYGSKTDVIEPILNGVFSANLFQLPSGTEVTVKAYIGNVVVDADKVRAGEITETDFITELKAVYAPLSTQISGKCATAVTKIELTYGSRTDTLEPILNGAFSANLFQLPSGTEVTVKAYVGTALVETEKVTAGDPVVTDYITEVKAVYAPLSTQISAKCAAAVTKVELIYGSRTDVIEPILNGAFSANLFQLPSGTEVTVKAYVGTELVETERVTAGGPVVTDYITEVKAAGTTVATEITGKYTNGVTKVEVSFSGKTYEAERYSDGTFAYAEFPALTSGTSVTVKAYVGTELKTTVNVNVQ